MKIEIHVNTLVHQRTGVLSVVASRRVVRFFFLFEITKIVKIHVEVNVHQRNSVLSVDTSRSFTIVLGHGGMMNRSEIPRFYIYIYFCARL